MVWKHTVTSQIVRAYVPLAEMFGYATVLRSASQGRGTFMMVFDHYEDVPKSVQEEIIKKLKVKLNLPMLKKLFPLWEEFFFVQSEYK